MAIVKMKRLRLIGMQVEREAILEKLQRLGCVEIDNTTPQPDEAGWALLSRPDGQALADARQAHTDLESALKSLKTHAPWKKKLLTPRRPISHSQLFDEGAYHSALADGRAIVALERQIAALYAQQSKIDTRIMALAPWLEVDLPLETAATRTASVVFCGVSGGVDLTQVTAALEGETPLAQFIPAGRDRQLQYGILFCHRSSEEDCVEALKPFEFSRISLRGFTGTALENHLRLEAERQTSVQAVSQAVSQIASYSGKHEALQCALDRATQDIAREDAKSRLVDSGAAFYLGGWVEASAYPALEKAMATFTYCCECTDPQPDEYPQVPVKLKNNIITRPLNMVTEMYALPAYDGVDPNPLMAPFFILFYGIMMADMGYGLLMMIASMVVLFKMKPKAGMAHFFGLMGLCGISTFIMGALTGGFFGDFLPQLAKIINPETTFTALPALFTPLNDTLFILIGAMALGFVQIVTGMAISFINKLKNGKFMDALWEEVTWWVVFAGLGLMALGITPLLLAVGGLMVLVGAGWNAKGFGKVLAVFGSLYNHVTGYFGDILSYSRLMALMLAGSVIAQVFNTLGAIPGNVIVFLVISLAGNALNFALNLLGCYVHDLRLQCLEYFGKFYQDGGKPFRPLSVNTKFVDITE